MTEEIELQGKELITQLKKEVRDEFVTSDQNVYKEGLRTLAIKEQGLNKQINKLKAEVAQLDEMREALDQAFMRGDLHSIKDARGVVRQVREKEYDNTINKMNYLGNDSESIV